MGRIRTALAALIVPMALIGPSVPAAEADDPPAEWYCVSAGEFKRAKKGMTRAKVHSIFGITGTGYDLSTPKIHERYYNHCIDDFPFRFTFVNYKRKVPGGPWRLVKKWKA